MNEIAALRGGGVILHRLDSCKEVAVAADYEGRREIGCLDPVCGVVRDVGEPRGCRSETHGADCRVLLIDGCPLDVARRCLVEELLLEVLGCWFVVQSAECGGDRRVCAVPVSQVAGGVTSTIERTRCGKRAATARARRVPAEWAMRFIVLRVEAEVEVEVDGAGDGDDVVGIRPPAVG